MTETSPFFAKIANLIVSNIPFLRNGETALIVGLSTFVIATWFMVLQLFVPWGERKVMARMQGRRGPVYVGFRGILQIPADTLKLMFKEDVRPEKSDRLGFFISVAIITITSILGFAPIPVARNFIGGDFAIGAIYVFAIFSLFPPAMFIGGWAGNSKYSLIGGFRSAGQLLAYEIPMFVSIFAIFAINGSFSLITIAENQVASTWNLFRWGGIGLVAGFIFFIAGVAETERIPFDIPEAEAELVMGARTEFSGWRYALIMMVEYIHLTVNSLVFIFAFLGGYDLFPWKMGIEDNVWVQIATVNLKLVVFVFIAAWMRSALPRMRIDQLLSFGWKNLLPLSLLSTFTILAMDDPALFAMSSSYAWLTAFGTWLIIAFVFAFKGGKNHA